MEKKNNKNTNNEKKILKEEILENVNENLDYKKNNNLNNDGDFDEEDIFFEGLEYFFN